MTINIADRVFETTTTQGLGTINLSGPVTGFLSLVSAVGSGKKVPYIIEDGTDWEVGIGTVTSGTPSTLSRTTVHASSNGNALVNWGPGTRNVRIGPSAKHSPQRDENLNLVEGLGTATGTATAHTVTLTVPCLGYSDGQKVRYYAPAANTSGAFTVNVDGRGAKSVKFAGMVPAINDVTLGKLLDLEYVSSLGWFEIRNTTDFVATDTEAKAGTSTTKMMTPANTAAAISAIGITTSSLKDKILSGLTLSNNSTDSANDIDVAAGSCVSDDGTTIITLSSLTKRLDAAWAVGTNQGGIDTGSAADNVYYVWAIMRTDTSVTDVVMSLSSSAPTMPSGYTKKCMIGSFARVSSTNKSPQNKDVLVTQWVAYTPTFTGFGSVTGIEFYSRRVGSNLEIRGRATCGTPTATEARMSIGYNGTDGNVTTANGAPIPSSGTSVCGGGTEAQNFSHLNVLVERNLGYVTFGYEANGSGGLAKANGNVMIGTNQAFTFEASVPVQGW